LLELIFKRINQKSIAQTFIQAFEQVYQEEIMPQLVASTGAGTAVVTNPLPPSPFLLPVLRTFRAHARALSVDSSWGILDVLRKTLHLSPLDLEDRESVLWDMQQQKAGEGQEAAARWRALMLQREEARNRLRQQKSYQELLKRAPGAAFFAAGSTKEGQQISVTNDEFGELFESASQLAESTAVHRLVMPLLFLSMVAPEDRMESCLYFWKHVSGIALRKQQTVQTLVLKMVDRHGEIGLFLLKVCPLAGEVPGLAVIFEPCPRSRHINPRPKVRQVTGKFKECARSATPDIIPTSKENDATRGGDGGAGVAKATAEATTTNTLLGRKKATKVAGGGRGGGRGGGGSNGNIEGHHSQQRFEGSFPSLAIVTLATPPLLQQPSSLPSANPFLTMNPVTASAASTATSHEPQGLQQWRESCSRHLLLLPRKACPHRPPPWHRRTEEETRRRSSRRRKRKQPQQ
jgi:hypothetical protein